MSSNITVADTFDESAFSDEAIAIFGSRLPILAENKGLLHVQIGDLASAIRGQKLPAKEVIEFLENCLTKKDASSEIENALATSFLTLDEAKDMKLPARIRAILEEQAERDT